MPRSPKASRTAAGVPARWCMRIFKDHDPEGVWNWFAALSSKSMARRSVLSLWHEYRCRTRQLFGDAEMRRRIMGIKNGEYVALSVYTVKNIVEGWRAEDAEARKSAKSAKSAAARAASEPPLPIASDPASDLASDPASDPEFYGPEDAARNSNKYTFRLPQLQELLEKCRVDGVVEFQDAGPLVDRCFLGWNKLSVKNPLEFNIRAKDMVNKNHGNVWQSNGWVSNSTWPVYETLREIGLKPRFRGPVATDPGRPDCLYYLEWLGKDRSFEAARLAFEECVERV